MTQRSDRFPLMDSLRAIAAMCVLAAHGGAFSGAYAGDSTLGIYLARLEVGVPIFFLISGFLLYRPFLKARLEGRDQPATGPYAWRRFLRIVPAYWLALTVIALALGIGGVFTAGGVPTYYGFAQAYDADTIRGGLPQAWSLCVELAFYAFLPLWALVMRSLPGPVIRTEVLGLAALIAVSIAWKLVFAAEGVLPITPELSALPAYWDQFALGMGVALMSLVVKRGRLIEFIDRYAWAFVLTAIASLIACGAVLDSDQLFAGDGNATLTRHGLYTLTALCMLLPFVFGTRGLIRKLMGHPLMLWLGLISYGIFLWNVGVLVQLERWGYGDVTPFHPYIEWIGGGLLATIPLAVASWYLLERHALALKTWRP